MSKLDIKYFSYDFQCDWSDYDKLMGNDQPWMCQMPNVIGSIAVFIALVTITVVIYNFVNFIQTNVRIGNGRESTLELLIQDPTTTNTRLSTSVAASTEWKSN